MTTHLLISRSIYLKVLFFNVKIHKSKFNNNNKIYPYIASALPQEKNT